jgi:hypothetical protein
VDGRRRPPHLPPRARPPAALQSRHAPGEHRGPEGARRDRRAGGDGLRRFLSNRLPDGSLCTFFTGPGALQRGHWIYESPFSGELRSALLAGGEAAGVAVRDGGCYGHVDGPRFNTRAEIRGLAAAGVTAVSQTAGPETVLCGEAELPYALLGFPTDYANGVKEEATPVDTLVEMMAASSDVFAAVLGAALPLIDVRSPPGVVYRFPSAD